MPSQKACNDTAMTKFCAAAFRFILVIELSDFDNESIFVQMNEKDWKRLTTEYDNSIKL